jgi:predicted lipoprotein with Yx(FWY)xxD motif
MSTHRLVLAGAILAASVAASACSAGIGGSSGGAQQGWTSSSPYAAGASTSAGTDSPAPEPSPTTAVASPANPAEGIVVQRLVAASLPKLGAGVTDGKGWVLYRFNKDTASPPRSNCKGACAQKWPPVLTTDNPELTRIPYENVGWLLRGDGSRQVTLNGWPLYRYAGDSKPGQWKGQGVDGKWFAVLKNGARSTVAPAGVKATPSAAPTPATGNGY